MCGIIGILGSGDSAPAILHGLKRLEYRGYDSAGIAVIRDGKIERQRAVGKLAALADRLAEAP
ncbi:MAG: glutamine--fructose-6-phosphate aminotransferase, partial [Pseudomonadota bacterium]